MNPYPDKLSDAERERLLRETIDATLSGYGGMLPNGNLVDRRKFPYALPLKANTLLGVPESKPVTKDKP